MALDFATIPTSGNFFKPTDHEGALAILVEPTAFRRDVPGQYGPKNEVTATLTIFNSETELDGATEPTIMIGDKFNQTILAGDLETLIGKATIVKLAKRAPKNPGQQPAWVWQTVTGEARDKVVAFAVAREKARAEAVSGEDAPDFLK